MRFLFRLFIVALMIGLPATAVILGVDDEPLVPRPAKFNFDDLKRAEKLAERFDPRRMPAERTTMVRATTDELNTLLKGVVGGVKQVAGRPTSPISS